MSEPDMFFLLDEADTHASFSCVVDYYYYYYYFIWFQSTSVLFH